MCWCLKVFFRVCANLTCRLCSFIVHQLYKICCVCWCPNFTSTSSSNRYESNRNSENNCEAIFHESFYQDVDRNTAEKLLYKKQDGTFIIRPTHIANCVAILSVIQNDRIFHLTIRRRRDGKLSLGNEKINERCFGSLNELINFYISNYLMLQSTDATKAHTLLLPFLGC
ncbi:uncharacterized protein LOC108736066 [Agrilus planipennis]|uniref:Uncharacterized protein LOC108736066 n=1 Tax=Agrilus planipennis TaxID=224129 RepID=A0A1W4WIU2_AGRPL|nr:uncharacterized protein LOC108736066 [Agrilus planipennis]